MSGGLRGEPPCLLARDEMMGVILENLLADASVVVAIADLDFFANIIEKIGWDHGNALLHQAAQLFIRSGAGAVGRYGSDEFILLFADTPLEKACEALARLRKDFRRNPFKVPAPYERIRVSYSAGVAYAQGRDTDLFFVLKKAEAALLEAKKNGRSQDALSSMRPISMMEGPGACTTVIGHSLKGRCADGANAFTASISEPYGVDVDVEGNLLFVDRSNHRIMRVRDGLVEVVYGKQGADEDRRAKPGALLKPSGVCIHRSGSIFVADTGNHRIVEISGGTLTTVAGSGENGYSGDGGFAPYARLSRPGGVAVDRHGNLFTNDYGNNVIRRIDTHGRIATVAGSGAFGYSGDGGPATEAAMDRPYGLCVDAEGRRLYIADYGNHCVRIVELASGTIDTLCGIGEAGSSGDGGHCAAARLNGPFWCSLHRENLYIADALNHVIRRVDLRTRIIQTAAGGFEAGYLDHLADARKARLSLPAGLAAYGDALYIADYGNNAIRKVLVE